MKSILKTDNYTIRIADLSIMKELCSLLESLFSMDIEFVPNYEKQIAGLRQIIQDKKIGEILVLLDGNKCVAMVSLLYSVSTALGGKVAILEDMIVDKKYRNTGLGSLLLSNAIEYAKNRGCLRITLLTDFDNFKAQNFYQKFGFTKSSMLPLRLIF